MNRFLIAAITLVALTAAAQAEIMCTQHGGCRETGRRIMSAATVVALPASNILPATETASRSECE